MSDFSSGSPSERIVLVVEDYEPNLMVAGILLNQMNYDYDSAISGTVALDKITSGKRYAAIMMDLNMNGLNGLMTTRRIREYETANGLPLTPILGVTAHWLPGAKEDCLSAGMNDFLTKPYTPEDLRACMSKMIQD